MEYLNEKVIELETLFTQYKKETDLRISNLEKQINKEITCKDQELCITIVKYKKSILVTSTYDYNTTQPYKEHFKKLEGKWMKTGEICGWIYPGKCPDDSLEKNSQFILDYLIENEIKYTVKYNE